tara:strand:- start:94 stop:693 length:600 start_codon:yes stop_codon:yes gene_type:complete
MLGSDSFFKINGADTHDTAKNTSSKISDNLITFQGDLNYDGRVSMKDLAFLNAGALNESVKTDGIAADDVDADYDGTISTKDLAILDRDWGGSLHGTKGKSDVISSDTWDAITNSGGKEFTAVTDMVTFDNSSFNTEADLNTSLSGSGGIPNPLAGDIYSGIGDLYTTGAASGLFADADPAKSFDATSAPIIGFTEPVA